MKTITKAEIFLNKMEEVETMNERQLVELLFRGKEVITDLLNSKAPVTREVAESITSMIETVEESFTPIDPEGVITIQSVNEKKGIVLGNYVKDGVRTYFSHSSNYSHPVVFGCTSLTNEVLDGVLKEFPEYADGPKKDLKSVSYFAKIGGENAMVHLVDYKRQAYEGYIGDYLFSTTQEYLDKGYKPLVTRADVFIANGGKHNSPSTNACTDSMLSSIRNIIVAYKSTDKYTTAMRDTNYITSKKTNKVAVTHSPVITLPIEENTSSSIIDPTVLLAITGGYDDCYEF